MLVCLVRWRMDNKHNISPYYQFSASILYEGKAKLVEGNNRHSAHWKQSQFCRVYAYCWFVMYIKRLKGDCCCKCGSEQTADLWRTGQSSGLTCPFTCNLECLILNDHHIIFFYYIWSYYLLEYFLIKETYSQHQNTQGFRIHLFSNCWQPNTALRAESHTQESKTTSFKVWEIIIDYYTVSQGVGWDLACASWLMLGSHWGHVDSGPRKYKQDDF